MNTTPDAKNILFKESDFHFLSLRWLIRLIDGSVLFVSYCISIIISLIFEGFGTPIMTAWIVFVFVYMVGLKSTRFGTLGYLITKVKVVGIDGKPASLYKNLLRLTAWVFFPFSVFWDLFWMIKSGRRQTFSDRISETYVVNKNFESHGTCSFNYTNEFFNGMTFTFIDMNDKGTP